MSPIFRIIVVSLLGITLLSMAAQALACDEDDLTDYEVLVEITIDGPNGWKFIR